MRLCLEFGSLSLLDALLCAISVFSVPLWFNYSPNRSPQRHREHRDCTEKPLFTHTRSLRAGGSAHYTGPLHNHSLRVAFRCGPVVHEVLCFPPIVGSPG